MKLTLKEYKKHDEYGTWGEWTYGKEHGTFGRSLRGMWAQHQDALFIGLHTYEQDITDRFKQSIVQWRRKTAKFKRFIKKLEAE